MEENTKKVLKEKKKRSLFRKRNHHDNFKTLSEEFDEIWPNKGVKIFLKLYVLPLLGYSQEASNLLIEKMVKSKYYEQEMPEKHKVLYDDGHFLHFGIHDTLIYQVEKPDDIKAGVNSLPRYLLSMYSIMYQANKSLFEVQGGKGHELKPFENGQGSTLYYDNLCAMAVEKGIACWIANSMGSQKESVENLLASLEQWSDKTYEGHNVCFGFLYDPQAKALSKNLYTQSFTDFVKGEYSAGLSDGVSSMIRVDKNCQFAGYESMTKDELIYGCDMKKLCLPYRFAQMIEKNVSGKVIGIFLLYNGDIILAKNKEIFFIKRSGKWLNFRFDTFYSMIVENVEKNYPTLLSHYKRGKGREFSRQIFSTMLDVSLAHVGGIITVVDSKDKENYKNLLNVLSPIDILTNQKSIEELYIEEILGYTYDILNEGNNKAVFKNEYLSHISNNDDILEYALNPVFREKNKRQEFIEVFYKKTLKAGWFKTIDGKRRFDFFIDYVMRKFTEFNVKRNDLYKKLTKREMIIHLISDENHEILTFDKLDRKLRSELIGMDGACIIDHNGKIIAFGAIIKNDAGSAGGGRGAAAKKLSSFGGFAMKISTDGYIEVYVNYKKEYAIK